jgi:hypothetical protein
MQFPEFSTQMPEFPVPIADELPVSAAEAVNGLRRALDLQEEDCITRCYVANRPGENAGLVIASVVLEHDGYMRDAEIVINDAQRNEHLGERAITWFGLVSYGNTYDEQTRKYFMRGHAPIIVSDQQELVA